MAVFVAFRLLRLDRRPTTKTKNQRILWFLRKNKKQKPRILWFCFCFRTRCGKTKNKNKEFLLFASSADDQIKGNDLHTPKKKTKNRGFLFLLDPKTKNKKPRFFGFLFCVVGRSCINKNQKPRFFGFLFCVLGRSHKN